MGWAVNHLARPTILNRQSVWLASTPQDSSSIRKAVSAETLTTTPVQHDIKWLFRKEKSQGRLGVLTR
jgi:hypothetical protein